MSIPVGSGGSRAGPGFRRMKSGKFKMATRQKIVSVTVTRNAALCLSQHLASLQCQTRPIDQILVVDNDSSDGTAKFLAEHWPSIAVIALSTNEGIAGGLSRGFEFAMERKYDWIWMFDQDSLVFPDTLSKLLGAYDLASDRDHLALVAPVPVDAATDQVLLPLFWERGGHEETKPLSFPDHLTFADMVISSGSLLRLEAVAMAGPPRKDFFMDFVDFEYCLRLRRKGFSVAVVNDCKMLHTVGNSRKVNFCGKNMTWTTHAPWRGYYKVRNRTYVVWHEMASAGAKWFVLRKLLKQMVGTVLLDSQRVSRVCLMWRGFWDGIRGKLGIRVEPLT